MKSFKKSNRNMNTYWLSIRQRSRPQFQQQNLQARRVLPAFATKFFKPRDFPYWHISYQVQIDHQHLSIFDSVVIREVIVCCKCLSSIIKMCLRVAHTHRQNFVVPTNKTPFCTFYRKFQIRQHYKTVVVHQFLNKNSFFKIRNIVIVVVIYSSKIQSSNQLLELFVHCPMSFLNSHEKVKYSRQKKMMNE